MGKPAGSMKYSLPEVMHMLDIIKKILPQDKDMWDSVSARYDATKASHWPDRNIEGLRRKLKSLSGLRKPTGCADMPVHVGLAKEVTRLIDEASSVFVTSEDELEEEKRPPPGQCQTPRPAPENPGEVEESSRASQGSVCADTFDSYGTLPPFSLSDDEEPLLTSSTAASAAPQAPSSNPKAPLTADAREGLRYPKLSDSSDRLGGLNLAEMRDTMQKRTYSEFEEANYTKQK
ncbi:hypothetical protein Pcac1_g17061 [Phytophthora cactorum]|nr:hypothetical protein Pcac1_g17061 [Phytophthora cactorum]KAG3067151.1 hypothetical protein PC122_g17461 [Phytophthora cactorum]